MWRRGHVSCFKQTFSAVVASYCMTCYRMCLNTREPRCNTYCIWETIWVQLFLQMELVQDLVIGSVGGLALRGLKRLIFGRTVSPEKKVIFWLSCEAWISLNFNMSLQCPLQSLFNPHNHIICELHLEKQSVVRFEVKVRICVSQVVNEYSWDLLRNICWARARSLSLTSYLLSCEVALMSWSFKFCPSGIKDTSFAHLVIAQKEVECFRKWEACVKVIMTPKLACLDRLDIWQ